MLLENMLESVNLLCSFRARMETTLGITSTGRWNCRCWISSDWSSYDRTEANRASAKCRHIWQFIQKRCSSGITLQSQKSYCIHSFMYEEHKESGQFSQSIL